MRFGTDECDGWRVGPAPKAPRYGVNNKCFTPNGHNYRKNTDSLSSDLTSPNHYRKNTDSRSMSLTSPYSRSMSLTSPSETPTCEGTTASTTSSSQSCQNDQSETERDVQAES